jgi:hypothetical protein
MTKGPKGPRTKRGVLNRIIVLASTRPSMLGKEIKTKLEEEFDPEDVPGLRTIQNYMSDARKAPIKNIQDQPWSLGMMDKAGIPWEAAAWLLDCYEECEKRIMNDEQLWRLTNPYPMGTEPLEPIEGGWVFLTNRQAKWLWGIHDIVPAQEFPDPFQELCHWADQYAHAEMTAEYWGQRLDTRVIDADLFMYRQVSRKNQAVSEETKEEEE